jgi:hypothetical protein
MKIRSVGDELFHAYRRKHRYDELTVAFLNFSDAPKNQYLFRESNPVHLDPYLISILTNGFLVRINNEVRSRKVTDATLTVIDKKLPAYIIIRVVSFLQPLAKACHSPQQSVIHFLS